jgi:hypothetical protein
MSKTHLCLILISLLKDSQINAYWIGLICESLTLGGHYEVRVNFEKVVKNKTEEKEIIVSVFQYWVGNKL